MGMDTLPFTPLELVAIDAARNLRRRWRVAAYRDLFGRVMVETGWGRIGGRGRGLVRSFADEADALRYVRALLTRRGSATRRIGVPYRPIHPTCRFVDMPTGRAPAAPLLSSHT
jgi:predicted DNA-binding WGR domain protein